MILFPHTLKHSPSVYHSVVPGQFKQFFRLGANLKVPVYFLTSAVLTFPEAQHS